MAQTSVLSPLGVSALGLLGERPMHPYEMYQLLLQRHEDKVVKVRPGTLYHAVARLAADGLVQAVGTEREGNRPERTTYALLPRGQAALEARIRELLAVPGNEYPAFPQALDEAHNLAADVVLALLRQRLAAQQEELAFLNRSREQLEAQGLPRRYWLDVSYRHTVLAAEIAWVRALCSELDAGTLAW